VTTLASYHSSVCNVPQAILNRSHLQPFSARHASASDFEQLFEQRKISDPFGLKEEERCSTSERPLCMICATRPNPADEITFPRGYAVVSKGTIISVGIALSFLSRIALRESVSPVGPLFRSYDVAFGARQGERVAKDATITGSKLSGNLSPGPDECANSHPVF
jgi:hypothetical protein